MVRQTVTFRPIPLNIKMVSLGNMGNLSVSDNGSGTVCTADQILTKDGEDITLYSVWSQQAEPSGLDVADYTIAKERVLRRIPDSAITAARNNLHILYCGTSHSQQVMEGMAGLTQYETGDDTTFAFTYNGEPQSGKLDIDYRGADGTDLSADS